MSARELLRSMLVTGAAQFVSIAVIAGRTKALAMLLGPTGVGLLSVYTNLQQMFSTGFGLGIESSAVREIAVKGESSCSLATLRRVLLAGNMVQGLVAMSLVWCFRESLAIAVLDDSSRSNDVALVGVAVLFTLVATAQSALLRGLLRISDLSRVVVWSSLVGTIVGLGFVGASGEDGLVAFVIAQPLSAIGFALQYTKRLPKGADEPWPRLSEAWAAWKPMASLGLVFMFGGLVTTATLLLVRSIITQSLGLDAAGQFAASWSITTTYVGFLLQAMGADYLPRLSQVINHTENANKLVNDQAQLGIALGGPILLLLLGGAPWLIHLLYSDAFAEAAVLLRWQTVGNVFKLACWPLGFMFVASARGRVFLLLQINANALFLILLWIGIPLRGLPVAGTAFLAAYIGQFMLLISLARSLQKFRWERLSVLLIATHASLSIAILILAHLSDRVALFASMCASLLTAVCGLRVVLRKIGTADGIPSLLAGVFEKLGWPLKRTI